jgi:hypothetical protein
MITIPGKSSTGPLKRSYCSLVGWGGSIEMVMNFPATDCLHICVEPLGKLFHAVGVLPDALDKSLSQPFLSEKRLFNWGWPLSKHS